MRVISGKAKGIVLKTPEGMQTRPTADRVKEALFSILQFDLPGTRVLDLFGGTEGRKVLYLWMRATLPAG